STVNDDPPVFYVFSPSGQIGTADGRQVVGAFTVREYNGAMSFDFDPQRYPTTPGCYLMRDAAGRVIYVGKATNLRRRLTSYFRPGHHRRTRLS
ncbi:MAG TPA: GIY-YIG nuclease family protein, partial [Anaerolineae bacterium]|nr:GIY-YIG nuclease family protein [Anaerolineae bacterium]HQK14326.1 GIY-YIG nuclease family protein [Anaerolineae bacterium]